MFTPYQSAHSFSPQRRQILGTGKRGGATKTHLGTDEAASVGPQKLFADLKQTSGSKPGESQAKNSVFSKSSPSRALAEKTNQSPQRGNGEHGREGADEGSSVPVKPSKAVLSTQTEAAKGKGKSLESNVTRDAPSQHPSPSQLVSPSKVGARVDAIFASASPTKRKKKARQQQDGPVKSAQKQSRPISTPSPVKRSNVATPSASPLTRVQSEDPKQKTPSALSKEQLQCGPQVFTPASNIGHAGAIRLRMGEMMDALNEQQEPVALDGEAILLGAEKDLAHVTEEEAYPEIEYMPPRIDVPHELPPALDDLPRGAELGEMMARGSFGGTYRPKNHKSIELQRQELLQRVPPTIRAAEVSNVVQVDHSDPLDDPWPDVDAQAKCEADEVNAVPLHITPSGSTDKRTLTNRRRNGTTISPLAASTKMQGTATEGTRLSKQTEPSQKKGRPAHATENTGKRVFPIRVSKTTASGPPLCRATTHPRPESHSSLPRDAPKGKIALHSTTTTSKARTLLGDKSNTSAIPRRVGNRASSILPPKKLVMNPALTDFENDKLGKALRTKLQAVEFDAHEGFSL